MKTTKWIFTLLCTLILSLTSCSNDSDDLGINDTTETQDAKQANITETDFRNEGNGNYITYRFKRNGRKLYKVKVFMVSNSGRKKQHLTTRKYPKGTNIAAGVIESEKLENLIKRGFNKEILFEVYVKDDILFRYTHTIKNDDTKIIRLVGSNNNNKRIYYKFSKDNRKLAGVKIYFLNKKGKRKYYGASFPKQTKTLEGKMFRKGKLKKLFRAGYSHGIEAEIYMKYKNVEDILFMHKVGL